MVSGPVDYEREARRLLAENQRLTAEAERWKRGYVRNLLVRYDLRKELAVMREREQRVRDLATSLTAAPSDSHRRVGYRLSAALAGEEAAPRHNPSQSEGSAR